MLSLALASAPSVRPCARCAVQHLVSSSRALLSTLSAAPVAPVSSAPPSLASAPAVSSSRVGAFGARFEVGRLEAVRRSGVGKSDAKWARMNGFIPGLIYGGGASREPLRIYVKEADLRAETNRRRTTFLNTLFDIVVDGVAYRVLPRDFQLHPFRPKIICCNWVHYRPGRAPGVKVDIPLRAINEERCPAYKSGGWLLELQYKLPVFAHGDEVPDYLLMDLRGKKVGDKIMASEVELQEGITMRVQQHDFAIAKFVGSKRGLGGAAEEGAETKATPAAASGGKAAAGGDAAKGGAAAGGDAAKKGAAAPAAPAAAPKKDK